MTEEEYLEQIEALWPLDDGPVPENLLSVASAGVRDHPASSSLWCLYGDVIQLAYDPVAQLCPIDVLAAYRKAIAIDPNCIEAWEGIGYFLDVIRGDFAGAEQAFRCGITLGGTSECYSGLARLLAENGKESEALELLSDAQCPFSDSEVVMRRRIEILRGDWKPL